MDIPESPLPRGFDPSPEGRETAQLEHSPIEIMAHAPSKCAGEACALHNRSDHKMRAFMQHWRDDRGLMERICTHGVGHPDPDQWDYLKQRYGKKTASAEFVHGCDGCCRTVKGSQEVRAE